MSDIDDLDALLLEMEAGNDNSDKSEAVEAEDVTSVLDEVVVEEAPAPEPPKVKTETKRRGRPPKAKVEEVVSEPEEDAETSDSTEPDPPAVLEETTTEEVVEQENSDEVRQVVQTQTEDQKTKDIYILTDAQIINGHIYRRGQKISFVKGDKFYNSQIDRNGNNWLDLVDDVEAQVAYFGRMIVEADHWSGIPLGSSQGIEHPGLALAVSKFAQEEYKRNGVPFA